jgi:LPXTG-motif cell wall-anchored protein
MMMKSNKIKLILIYSLVLLTIVVFLPISNTGADSNTTEIKIDTLPETVLFDIKNFKPGDWAPREFTIQNNGNLDFSYNIKARLKSGTEKLYNVFDLKIEDSSKVIFEGDLKDFNGLSPRQLKSHAEEKLTLTVTFPSDPGNEYQGLQTEVEFIIYAEGDNPPPPPPDGEDPGDGENPGDGDGTNPPDNNENEPPNNNPTPTKPSDPPSNDTGSLPKTGEENPIFIILSGVFISIAGFGLLLIKKSILPNPFKRG